MKTIIYWFSATGNSLAAARLLEAALVAELAKSEAIRDSRLPVDTPTVPAAQDTVELRPMAAALKEAGGAGRIAPGAGTGRIVLVFPLFYLSWPALVDAFLERLDPPAGCDLVALVTRGMWQMGAVLGDLDQRLRRQGRVLRLGRYLETPNNDIILFNACAPAAAERKLGAMPAAIRRFAAEIAGGGQGRSREWFAFMRGFRYPVYQRKIPGSHSRFRVEAGCTGCGICVKVCALDRIILEAGRPVWRPGCQECEACINFCPARAIEYGDHTTSKRRYLHPEARVPAIAAQKVSPVQ